MAERKIPLRKCLGCGEMKEKKQLLRVVRSKEGEISVDFLGKAPGRGAYLCLSVACFDTARKSRRLERTFSAKIEEEIFDTLRERIISQTEKDNGRAASWVSWGWHGEPVPLPSVPTPFWRRCGRARRIWC